jgi:hypothetical protein
MDRNIKHNLIGISGKIGSGKDTVGRILQYLALQKKIDYKGAFDDDFAKYYDSYYNHNSDFKIKKFADKLKQIASLLTGIPVENFESQEFKKQDLPEEWRRAGWQQKGFITLKEDEHVSYRHLLQVLGTNVMREGLHPNVWVNALFADYVEDTGYTYPIKLTGKTSEESFEAQILADPVPYNGGFPNWIITDVRFENEAKAVKENGGILIRIKRPKVCDECGVFGGHKMIAHKKTEHPSETGLDSYEDWDHIIHNDGTIDELIQQIKQLNII